MKRFLLCFLTGLFVFITNTFPQTVTLDNFTQYQTIEGFGGFGPNKVWWSSPPFYNQDYFDVIINDLGANIVRTQLYWDFEESNDNGDDYNINWSGFNYGSNSDNGKQFDFMTDLDAEGDIKQIATVWTPPVWMKLDYDNSLASFCNGQCGGYLNPSYYDEFAEYCVAYVKRLKLETGVELYALSLQNELEFPNAFESCVYDDPADYAELVKIVGKRFDEEGLDTKFFGPEHMGNYNGNKKWFDALLKDDSIVNHLDIYAVHSYQDGVSPDYGSADGWTNMYNKINKYNKSFWMTETSGQAAGWQGAWDMGRALHVALRFGKINAWVYWYFIGNLVEDNNPTNRYKLFYAFKSYYKHISPGAVQILSSSDDSDILPTAFYHEADGKLTLVLVNNSGSQKTASINIDNAPSTWQVYRTSSTEDFIDVGTMNNSSITLPGESFSTLVYQGSNNSPAIDQIYDTVILKDAGEQTINLSGISDGNSGSQSLSLSVSNTNTTLNPSLSLDYTQGDATGTIKYTTAAGKFGLDTITVHMEDDGDQTANFHQKQVSFVVRVIPFVNNAPTIDTPDDVIVPHEQQWKEVNISGITDGDDGSQDIQFSAESNDLNVVKYPSVTYTGGTTAILKYLVYNIGEADITITAQDNGGAYLGGTDSKSITFSITVADSVGSVITGKSKEDKGIKLYPVPANDYLKVELPVKAEKIKIVIRDMLGKAYLNRFYAGKSGIVTISTESLRPGIYNICVISEDKTYRKQFLVK